MPSAESASAPAGRAPEPIPISALNHYLYCPRRAYLIHAEGVFVDNEHTLLGDLAHEHVDFPGYEQRAGWTLLRALPLFSDTLGLSGKADLVEVRRDEADRVVAARPVEYKKGPKRKWSNDEVQLCAQALCLEEMFGLSIDTGAIYHASSERRTEVALDPPLRERTRRAIAELRALLAITASPAAELKPRCEGCSLHEVCMPEVTTSVAPSLYVPRKY